MWYYIINVTALAILAVLCQRGGSAKFYWTFLILKLVAGISLGLVYTYYYSSGDTFGFFNGAKALADLARDDFSVFVSFLYSSDSEIINTGYTWTPNLVFVKFASIFCLITGDSYWLISLYFSLFCFAALWRLYLVITGYFTSNDLAIAIGLFLLPSFVFWSSGLSKESIAVGCIALMVAPYIKGLFVQKQLKWIELVVAVLSIILLWKLKYFYAGVLIVTLITGWLLLLLFKKSPSMGNLKLTVLSVVIFLGLLVIASFAHPNFYLSRIVEVIVQNHDELILKSDSGIIRFYELNATFSSLLINAPLALFSGLFSPLIWQVNSILELVTGFENVILMFLSAWAIVKSKRLVGSEKSILLVIGLMYIMVMATLLALSTPNFGTLMRFKVAFLPFLYMLVLYHNSFVRHLSDRLFN